jgi:hypothetical protein
MPSKRSRATRRPRRDSTPLSQRLASAASSTSSSEDDPSRVPTTRAPRHSERSPTKKLKYSESASEADSEKEEEAIDSSDETTESSEEDTMADRRQATSSSSRGTTGVRRNLFHQHLSRRPTTGTGLTASASTEALQMGIEEISETSDIVMRDKNGDYEVGDPPIPPVDDQEEQGNEMQEDESKLQ